MFEQLIGQWPTVDPNNPWPAVEMVMIAMFVIIGIAYGLSRFRDTFQSHRINWRSIGEAIRSELVGDDDDGGDKERKKEMTLPKGYGSNGRRPSSGGGSDDESSSESARAKFRSRFGRGGGSGDPGDDDRYGSRVPRGNRKLYRNIKIAIGVVAFIVAIVVAYDSVVIVPAGDRGIVLNLGAPQPVVLDPGMHTIEPFVQSVVLANVQTQKYEAVASSASKDLQSVTTEVAITYHPVPAQVNQIYQTLSLDYADKIISPTIQESVKATTAKFDSAELVTQRDIVKQQMESVIRNSVSDRPIIIEQVYITDFKFDPAFQNQTNMKAKAVQEYQTALNDLKTAQANANKTVILAQAQAQADIATKEGQVTQAKLAAQAVIEKAKGDAESIHLLNAELQNDPNYLQLQYIQKWNGQLPTFMGGSGINPLINIPFPTRGNVTQTAN